MKETKEETKPVLSEKQIAGIKQFMQTRFGIYGVNSYEIKYEETPTYTYKARFSVELPIQKLGIFKHALKQLTLSGEVWKQEKYLPKIKFTLGYIHIGSGSNGCDLSVKTHVNDIGEVFEEY